jgi:hypothetical protein
VCLILHTRLPFQSYARTIDNAPNPVIRHASDPRIFTPIVPFIIQNTLQFCSDIEKQDMGFESVKQPESAVLRPAY